MAWSDFVGGGDSHQFNGRYTGQTAGAIDQLSNSNFGAMAAAQTGRQVGRNYDREVESIDSNQSFGRNAAVSSALKDKAMEGYGDAVGKANVQGAETDANNRAKGAQLGLQADQLGMQMAAENYQREQDQSFGNSFVGGILKDAIGFGVGSAGVSALTSGGGNDGSDPGVPRTPKNSGYQVPRAPYTPRGPVQSWDQEYR